MVYVWSGAGASVPCAIDPALPLGGQPFDLVDLPPETSYAALHPEQRAAHLSWLASGARDPAVPAGYGRLYAWGLERRLVRGNPGAEEEAALLGELERVGRMFAKADPALWGLAAEVREHLEFERLLRSGGADLPPGRGMPLRTSPAFALAAHRSARRGWADAGTACEAFALLRRAALAGMREARAARALSALRRELDRRGGRWALRPAPEAPPYAAQRQYRGFMPGLRVAASEMPADVRDPLGLDWGSLADLGMAFAAAADGGGRSGAAAEATTRPARPLRQAPDRASRPLPAGGLEWLRALAGRSARPTSEVVAMVLGERCGGKPTQAQLRRAAETLHRLGHALEPDPDLPASAGLGPEGTVLVYRHAATAPPRASNTSWAEALTCLAVLGASQPVARRVADRLRLPPHLVQRLLEGVAWWSSSAPPGRDPVPIERIAALRRAGGGTERAATACAALAEEARSDEGAAARFERAFGQLQARSTKAKHRKIRVGKDDAVPVPFLPAELGGGDHRAPPPLTEARPPPLQEVFLDEVEIARVSEETRRVTKTLAAVFVDPALDAPEDNARTTMAASLPAGFPSRYAALWRGVAAQAALCGGRIEANAWAAACAAVGAGSRGAMDAVNEWAEEAFGEPALRESGGGALNLTPEAVVDFLPVEDSPPWK